MDSEWIVLKIFDERDSSNMNGAFIVAEYIEGNFMEFEIRRSGRVNLDSGDIIIESEYSNLIKDLIKSARSSLAHILSDNMHSEEVRKFVEWDDGTPFIGDRLFNGFGMTSEGVVNEFDGDLLEDVSRIWSMRVRFASE